MTVEQLQAENAKLHRRLQEAEETVNAIREGAVDAFLIQETEGSRVYTLEGADRPYRILVEQMHQGAATLDAAGAIAYCNLSLAELLQLPLEQLIGLRFDTFVPPADLTSYESLFRQGRARASCGEMQLKTAAGALVPAYLTLNALPQDAGAAVGVLVTDLAPQKHQAKLTAAYEMLQRREQQLRQANESLKQFAFAASHDLQEPLRMITSYSQMLVKKRSEPDEEALVCVRYITEGTDRMRELLADLLAYTEVNDDSEKFEVVDLNSVCDQAVENLMSSIAESSATVTRDDLPRVQGHQAHFLQLFQNLIGNSIKYRGERAPRIHISAAQSDEGWRLAVTDNGIGIHPDYHQRIFGVFKRLHGNKIPGTGIGLAICQRVVERNGGRIWVESRPDEGATFYFTLPSAKEVAA